MADYRVAADIGISSELEAALDELKVAAQARQRFTETDAYQGQLKSQYQRFHFYYQPNNALADQWPEDLGQRPGKIHMTVNIIKPAVNINARLQALVPRISLQADAPDDDSRRVAEAAEKLMMEWLIRTGWEVWLATLCRVRSLYGKGVLKVFWDKDAKQPNVTVVENPANLRVGWGSSDFTVKDWTLYEYALSPQEVSIRFPGVRVDEIRGDDGRMHLSVTETSTPDDPLNQNPGGVPGNSLQTLSSPIPYQPSQYEQKQLRVWDYWYKKPDGKGGFTVCNAMFVEGTLVLPAGQKQRIMEHPYLPDLPYIVIPEDTEPGNPEGLSMVQDLIDLQYELNRALSHWAQLVADEVDPAWVAEGEDNVPAGTVPKAGEIVAVGNVKVHALDKGFNVFPVSEFVSACWDHYHKITGLSEILFGEVPSAQTSGRAVAIQIEAAANRLDPKRRHLYSGLRDLLIFWSIMAERVNPKFQVGVDPETNKAIMVGAKAVIGGARRWSIVAPEITPRDVFENTNNEINKVNAGLSSRKTSMDELGIDAPEAELQLIRGENMDAQLSPEKVQAYTALIGQVQQIQATQQQMQQQLQQLPQGVGPLTPQGIDPNAAANAVQQQQFQAQPQAVAEDQNQPRTLNGSPPPAGGSAPQGTPALSTLIRGGQALNQLQYKR